MSERKSIGQERRGSRRAAPHQAASPMVFIVDDDASVRQSLVELVKSVGLSTMGFTTGVEFLEFYDTSLGGCLVLDMRLPGMSGFEVLERLAGLGAPPPVIMITGYADVSTAILAMKAGATDFIQKPIKDEDLICRVRRALEADARRRQELCEGEMIARRLASLTPREREVMELVVDGLTSREIAFRLSISVKTVEAHRRNLMRKMGVSCVAQLVRAISGATGIGVQTSE